MVCAPATAGKPAETDRPSSSASEKKVFFIIFFCLLVELFCFRIVTAVLHLRESGINWARRARKKKRRGLEGVVQAAPRGGEARVVLPPQPIVAPELIELFDLQLRPTRRTTPSASKSAGMLGEPVQCQMTTT